MLYNKYAPQTKEELVGQKSARNFLDRLTLDNSPNALILSGPSGDGKTTTARLYASQLHNIPIKKLSADLDYVEMDAASNGGVDEIRKIRDRLNLSTISGLPRIIYVDEAHNLSKAAWDALLKVIEEPKKNKFVFATTDINKIPDTIKTRSIIINFLEPTQDELKELVYRVSKKEGYTIPETMLGLIVFSSLPSFRDVLTKLESVFNYYGTTKNLPENDESGLLLDETQQDAIKKFPKLFNATYWLDLYALVVDFKGTDQELKNFAYFMYNYSRKVITNYVKKSKPINPHHLRFTVALGELISDSIKFNKTALETTILKQQLY